MLDSVAETHGLRYEELIAQGLKERMPPVQIHPEDVASLLYTSGTTGKPKGVLLTHRNLLSDAWALRNSGLASADDNFLVMLPLHHSYPFMIACLVPLLIGARMTFLQSLKGPDLLQCLQETQITMLVGVPQVFAMIRRAVFDRLLSRPPLVRALVSSLLMLSDSVRRRTGWNLGRVLFREVHQRVGGSLRLLCSGGAKLNPEVARDLERLGFTILEGYGLTETSPVVTFNPLAKPKIASVGIPIPGVKVRIVNPDLAGVGEVAVSGSTVMKGYDGNPTATAESIRDGWFHTGDLGYLDHEGYLFLTGRSKELIVTEGGKNIFPEELEADYQTSPAIAEICLIGANCAGEGAEGIHAVILPNFDYLNAQKVLDIRRYIKDELTRISLTLPPYKRITGISLIKEPLPRTRLGKIQRHKVASLLETEVRLEEKKLELSEMDQAMLGTETARRVLAILATLLPKTKQIHLDDHLDLDLGLDSLRRVELIASLEQQFGPLPDTLAKEVITVKDVINKLSALVLGPRERTATSFQSWHDLLEARPPLELTTRLLRTPSFGQRSIETVVRVILWLIGRLIFRLSVQGLEHLPRQGSFLLAPNHVSYADPFVVLTSLPKTVFDQLFALGWEPYFRSWIGRWVARIGHVIPVGTDTSLVTVLQTASTVLRQGKGLLIFPEGERSIDGHLLPFRNGIGILACELGIPIVPAWLEGTYQVLPVGAHWPRRYPISLWLGTPLTITQDMIGEWKSQGVDPYDTAAHRIREAVSNLAQKSQQAQ